MSRYVHHKRTSYWEGICSSRTQDQKTKSSQTGPREHIADRGIDGGGSLCWNMGKHQMLVGIEVVHRSQHAALVIRRHGQTVIGLTHHGKPVFNGSIRAQVGVEWCYFRPIPTGRKHDVDTSFYGLLTQMAWRIHIGADYRRNLAKWSFDDGYNAIPNH